MSESIKVNSIVEFYSKKKPVTDVCLVCKDEKELWYSKYQLYRVSDFFAAIFDQDNDASKITLTDYKIKTVALILHMMDNDDSEVVASSSELVELYKLSFYINFKKGMEFFTNIIMDEEVSINEYYTLKQFNFPNREKLIPNLITRIVRNNRNNGNIIRDVINYYQYNLSQLKSLLDTNSSESISEAKKVINTIYITKKNAIQMDDIESGDFVGHFYFMDGDIKYILDSNKKIVVGKIVNNRKVDLEKSDEIRLNTFYKNHSITSDHNTYKYDLYTNTYKYDLYTR